MFFGTTEQKIPTRATNCPRAEAKAVLPVADSASRHVNEVRLGRAAGKARRRKVDPSTENTKNMLGARAAQGFKDIHRRTPGG